jgi:predicted nucleic acid-binding protein
MRSDRGAVRRLLELALLQRFELALSEPIFLEYEAVLKRPQHLEAADISADDVDLMLERLSQVAHKVHLGHFRRPTVADVADEHVINLAWRARVDALVTVNLRDFCPAATTLGVHCCLPGEALRLLETGHVTDPAT